MTAYDANGNTQTMVNSSGTTTYAWDFENRLTSVALPASGGTVYFKYDPFGRRVYKSSSAGTSIYAYDGDNLVEETNSSGAAVARYSQGLNIDEPLAMLRSGTTSYYQADGLGSLTSLSNTSGALANTYTYDSFGNLVASSGSLVNSFRYTGREFDTETSLYYYRARYYDPQAGRFVSEDPMRWNAAQNFYEYVNNNSTNASDPLGLIACKECRKFLRYCYLTAGAAGFMGRWGCRTVCISVLKMPLTCWTVCTAAGAATAGALQVACYAGYQKCLKNCDQAPNVCSSGAPSGQTGSDFAGQNPQTSGPSGPVGGGGGGTIPW